MALIKRDSTGGVTFKPQLKTRGDYEAQPKQSFSDASALKEKAEQSAEKSGGKFSTDDMKYQIAVETAQDRLKDVQDVDDRLFQQTIDDIYENELQASTTGAEHRGENPLTQGVGAARNALNDLNEMLGGWIDTGFDATIGNLAGLGGDDMRQAVQGAFDGKDLAIIPDIAEDVALSLLGPAGIAAAVAKNAVQQSDNIGEFITGKDAQTMRDLDGWQRAGKGLESLGSIALSAVPGIGKTRNLASFGKELAKEDARIGKEFVDQIGPKLKDGIDIQDLVADGADGPIYRYISNQEVPGLEIPGYADRFKAGMQRAKDYLMPDSMSNRSDLAKAKGEAKRNAKSIKAEKGKDSEEYKDAISQLVLAREASKNARPQPINAYREARKAIVPRSKERMLFEDYVEPATKAADSRAEKIKDGALGMAQRTAMSLGTALPMAVAAEMGETGENPLMAAANASGRMLADPSSVAATAAAMLPLGARGFARRQASARGKYDKKGGMSFPAVRAGALGDQMSRMAQGDMEDGYDEGDINDRLLDYLRMGGE